MRRVASSGEPRKNSWSFRFMASKPLHSERWVWTTPRGTPPVPDVRKTPAGSSGEALGPGGHPAGASPRPARAIAGTSSTTTASGAVARHAARARATAADCSTHASTTTAFGCSATSTPVSSSSPSEGSTSTNTAPTDDTANAVATKAALLGSTTTTRSRWATPAARKWRASAWAHPSSSWYVTAWSSTTIAIRLGWRRATAENREAIVPASVEVTTPDWRGRRRAR